MRREPGFTAGHRADPFGGTCLAPRKTANPRSNSPTPMTLSNAPSAMVHHIPKANGCKIGIAPIPIPTEITARTTEVMPAPVTARAAAGLRGTMTPCEVMAMRPRKEVRNP